MGAFATSNPTGGSDITGSGTANQVAVFVSAQAIGVAPRNFTATASGFVIGSTTEETAGILTLVSTTQGFIPPRLTTAQRNAMPEVLVGMMLFNSTLDTLNVYTAGGGSPTWAGVITTNTMPATYAVGDILYASTTSTLARLASVPAGSYLRSGGDATAPVWSTLILPNAATLNQIVHASATNTYGGNANFLYDTVNTGLIVGTTALVGTADIANFRKDQNGRTALFVINNTSGTAAQSSIRVSSSSTGSPVISMNYLSATFTTAGINIADSANITTNATAGMQIGTTGSTPLSLWTNNTQWITITSTGLTFFGGSATATAFVHMAAGTTAVAPMKFQSGTNLTAAAAGAMEYNNTFFLTNSDATRRSIVLAVNATKTTAGAPYTNDGYITVSIAGTDVKVMTTA